MLQDIQRQMGHATMELTNHLGVLLWLIFSWVVDMAFVRRLKQPVTLHEIKESHLFDDWALVRQGRLSTMSVPDNVVLWLKGKKVL